MSLTLPFAAARLAGDADDVVVGRRDDRGRITEVAGPYDVDLAAGTVTVEVSGFSSYAVFGPAPPPVPRDFNGDGKGDLVIPTYRSGDAPGVVSIFFGRGGPSPVLPTSADDADARFVQATPANARFGSTWTDGDWNGDGFTDLAIGEFQFGVGSGQTGRVYVFLGGPGFAGTTTPAADADVILAGTHSLGVALASGDVDGDGTDDLVVSERDSARGKIRVYQGAKDFVQKQRVIATITGSAIAQELGEQLAVGDVTGDGNDDVVATAPANNDDLPFVVVFDGSKLSGELGPADADITLTGDHPVEQDVYTRPLGGLFVAEVTGDQKQDIVLLSDRNTPFVRTVHVFRGGAALVDGAIENSPIRISDHTPGDLYIKSVAVGDTGGDDAWDIVVVATNGVLLYAGGAETFGGPDEPSYTVELGWVSRLPHSLGTLPFSYGNRVLVQDAYGDGAPELIVTDPADSANAAQAGAAYLFFTTNLPSDEQSAASIIRGNAGDRFGE